MIFVSGIYANSTLARFLLVHMLNRKINFANKPEKLSQGLEGIFLIKDDRGSVTCITLLLQHFFIIVFIVVTTVMFIMLSCIIAISIIYRFYSIHFLVLFLDSVFHSI